MKQILVISLITLLALGTACAWISPSSDATSEGIQVHGHWTVTVTNPDGSVDAVHEFDNALTGDGARLLTQILAGEWLLPRATGQKARWLFPKESESFTRKVGSQLLYFVGEPQDYLETNGWMIRLISNWNAGGGTTTGSILVCNEGVTLPYGEDHTYLFPEVGPYYNPNEPTYDGIPSDYEFILSASCRVEGGDPYWVNTFEIKEVDVKAAARHRLSPDTLIAWWAFTHHVIPSDQSIMIQTGQVVGITIKISFG